MLNRFYDYLFPASGSQHSLQERFRNLRIDNDSFEHWVDHLACSVSSDLMTDPVILVTPKELEAYIIDSNEPADESNFDLHKYLQTLAKDDVRINPDKRSASEDRIRVHIFDRKTITEHWKIKPRQNPNNRDEYCHIIPFDALRQEIAAVLTMLEYIKKESNGEHADNNKLIAQGIVIPEQFKCAFTRKMMTYPVKLDNKEIVDLIELMQWWAEQPINKSIIPFTFKPIRHIEFQHDLYHELKQFAISCDITVRRPALEQTLVKARAAADSYAPAASCMDPANNIDENFICLLSMPARIMTHPVILDEIYAVDLDALENWWKQVPAYYLRNPITGDAVTTIEYNHELKKTIDKAHDDAVDTIRASGRPGGVSSTRLNARLGFAPFFLQVHANKLLARFFTLAHVPVTVASSSQACSTTAACSSADLASPARFHATHRRLESPQKATVRGLAAALDDDNDSTQVPKNN